MATLIYDRAADVLYITLSDEPAANATDDGETIRRYNSEGALVGITILNITEMLDRRP